MLVSQDMKDNIVKSVPSAITVILSCLEAAAIRVDAIQVALFMLTVIVLLASASVSRESQDSSVRSVKRGIFLWKKNVFLVMTTAQEFC